MITKVKMAVANQNRRVRALKSPSSLTSKLVAALIAGLKNPAALSTQLVSNMALIIKDRNTLNVCLLISVINLSLYGTACVKQLNALIAPLQKIVDLLEFELAPKAYPSSPMVLPDLENSSSKASEPDASFLELPLPLDSNHQ